MSLLATTFPAWIASLLFSTTPASGSPSASGGPVERGCGDAGVVRDDASRTPDPRITDCLGANTYTFGTVSPDTRCTGTAIVISADSAVEALECAAATAVRRGVQLAPSRALQTYVFCVTGPFGSSTHSVVSYSRADARECARS